MMSDAISAEEYTALVAAQKRPKYGNQRTVVDGIQFDSRAEAKRWCELRLLAEQGEITEPVRQPRYRLVVNGTLVCTYVADFLYIDRHGREHVEDVKGVRTPLYRLKKRLMKACYGIDIEEVSCTLLTRARWNGDSE